MGSPLFVAATSVAWAALHAEVGDEAAARALAEAASATAAELGYGQVASDAAALLARISG